MKLGSAIVVAAALVAIVTLLCWVTVETKRLETRCPPDSARAN